MDQPTPGDRALPKDLYRPSEAALEGETYATTQSHQAYVTLLFNKYRAALQRYLRRFVLAEDAAELVQETYFRLLRRGELLHVEPMARAFLFETATNLARDLRRRRLTRHADLPQDTRTVFLLHRYRDLSYPQIATLMNLSARTVARKMAEAIERLSAALGGAA